MVCKLSVLNVVISAPATKLRLMSGYYYFDLHECPKYKDLSIGFMIGRRVSYCGDSLFLRGIRDPKGMITMISA
jgi:hypothetical protein